MLERLWTISVGLALFGGLLEMKRRAYIEHLLRHKWYVLTAGLELGGIRLSRLLLHDLNKFFPEGFEVYRRQFYPLTMQEQEENRADLERAWRSHWVDSKHHWEYWTDLGSKDGVRSKTVSVAAMPEEYVREMVADWIAAIKEVDGKLDLQDWLDDAFPKMWFHDDTVEILRKVLAELNVFLPKSSQ